MQLELELRPKGATPEKSPRPEGEVEGLIEAFLLAEVESANTRRAYAQHLRTAFTTMNVHRMSGITLARLVAFRANTINRGQSSSTQAQALSALRAFFRWCSVFDWFPPELVGERMNRALRLPRVTVVSPPQIPSQGEIEGLFQRACVPNGDHAMLTVFLGAGLRISELCCLDCDDVRDDVGVPALMVRGKAGKRRLVPVQAAVLNAIRRYLELTGRQLGQRGPLFVAHDSQAFRRRDRRISVRSVRRRVKRLQRLAGISWRVRVHGLRHAFATSLLREGGRVSALQKVLGHAYLATTQRYVDHLELPELLESMPRTLVRPPRDEEPPG
jgi:site-specific recombinase XerD